MKKLLLALALFLPAPAMAGVSCSVPFNLQNGTTADASQVMANYNAIIACLANAAASGANSDITSLNGLTSPLIPSEGGTTVFIGTATGGGSPNAQVVASTSPNNFTLKNNWTVVYVAGQANTGAATLAANGATATTILRQVPGAVPAALTGGEITTGEVIVATYDGAAYELINPSSVNAASLTATDQNLKGGAFVTSNGLGSLSGGGSTTLDCGLSPLQFLTNAGNLTLVAPIHDGSCVILTTNNGSAGTISFSGFTVGANTGDSLDTVNTHKFMITVAEINAVATYVIKALQ